MANHSSETTAERTNWLERHAVIVSASDDERYLLSEAFDADWKEEYVAAFIAHALIRPGWDRENAEFWAGEIVRDALAAWIGENITPAEVARIDVLGCEREATAACPHRGHPR